MTLHAAMLVTCLLFVLELSAAPLESTTRTPPTSSTTHSASTASVLTSTSESRHALTGSSASPPSTATTPEHVVLTDVTETPPDGAFDVAHTGSAPFESSFSSDEAIRHLPGYWIKRPSQASAGGVAPHEAEEHPGEAQESFIDYRTERYQISDLFPAASQLPAESQFPSVSSSQFPATSQFPAIAVDHAATPTSHEDMNQDFDTEGSV